MIFVGAKMGLSMWYLLPCTDLHAYWKGLKCHSKSTTPNLKSSLSTPGCYCAVSAFDKSYLTWTVKKGIRGA